MNLSLMRRPAIRAGAIALMLAIVLVSWAVPGHVQAQTATPLSADVEVAVRAAVVAEAGVEEAEVAILRGLPVTWNDACLGITAPETQACAQVLTPGWAVWVEADNDVYVARADLEAETVVVVASSITIQEVDTAPLPEGAELRFVPARVITGPIPAEGVGLFAISAAATTPDILQELEDGGCSVVTLAVTAGGAFVVYVPGAPDFVNAGFEADFDPGQAFAVRCAEGEGTRDFSTDVVNRTGRDGNGVLTAVRIAEHDGYDRIVFEFGDELGEVELADGVPAYRIEYIDGPAISCGSGNEVQPEGNAILQVSLPGTFVYDPDTGEATIEQRIYGEDFGIILEVQEICAFEANSTWVIGTEDEAPFRVYELSSPTRLVIDVQVAD